MPNYDNTLGDLKKVNHKDGCGGNEPYGTTIRSPDPDPKSGGDVNLNPPYGGTMGDLREVNKR